jgi:hypothetical protein
MRYFEPTAAHLGSALTDPNADRRASYVVGTATKEKEFASPPALAQSKEHRRGMTRCFNNNGDLGADDGRASEAVEVLVQARDIQDALANSDPSGADYRNGQAFSLIGLARATAFWRSCRGRHRPAPGDRSP